MKQRSTIHHSVLLLGAGFFLLSTAASPALEIVAASFGGCGVSGSASYATVGTNDPGAGQPVGGPTMTFCPGPLAVAFQPVLAGEPKAHLVPSGAGVLTLMKIPDSPNWTWAQSTDLAGWSPLPEPAANPVLIPADQPRRFFRLEKP